MADRLQAAPGILVGADGTISYTLAGRKLTSGREQISWPGGTALSNTITLPHGLGATPVAFVGTGESPVVGAFYVFEYATADQVNVYVQGYATAIIPGVGAVGTFDWFAIG